jgi:acetyl esterase/lipase
VLEPPAESIITEGGVMKLQRLTALASSIILATPLLVHADQPAFPPLDVPARAIPVPDTVSPQMQRIIAAPLPAYWKTVPKSADEWKSMRDQGAARTLKQLPGLREQFGVRVGQQSIAGVNCFILTPEAMPEVNRDRLLMHLHAGAFFLSPGESGTREAILMAGVSHMKVVSVDFRMPPDFPYPAPVDDTVAVWKELARTTNPSNMAIFGSSSGGNLTMALMERAKQEGLPLPAAIALGSPAADLTKTGDTLFTNEFVDNVWVSYSGLQEASRLLYANGRDLRDPMLSPVYGDFDGFPPTILISGTRDLFLSTAARVHRKLRQAGIEALLVVFEGQSHTQYLVDPSAPETREAFEEIASFFDKHLTR